MRGLDNPATFSLPFVDVCVKVYQHLHMLRTTLQNSSVIFEGVLTNLDFWIACVGSQDAQDMISSIRNHKSFVKDCINAVFSCDAAAASSSVFRLFAQLKPQPLEFKKANGIVRLWPSCWNSVFATVTLLAPFRVAVR